MKRVILVVIGLCFLAGVGIITTGELQSQDVQNKEKIKQDQMEKPSPPKPKIDVIPEPPEMDTSSAMKTQKIFRLKVWIKSEEEQKIVKRIGLACEGKTECICYATEDQVKELKREGIEFQVERKGIKVEKGGFGYKRVNKGKGSAYDDNDSNYTIPEGDWTYSPINITSAPAGATVTSIDVYYYVIHPYIGQLVIDLTDQNLEHEWNLWYYEGGSGDNIEEAEWDITVFNGESVNQTWKLYAWDCCEGDTGYIDYWSIQIWYQDLPDLIVQSLTATDYNPNVGENIDVTMVVKNQGDAAASSFLNGLFYDLTDPPDIETFEDGCLWTSGLDPGETDTLTFADVTSYASGTWHTYVLADCDGEVVETNEANNHKGPITINWIQPLPDLIVQSLTVDDYSLVITEHTNGTITIKNQGSGPVVDCFYTDVFKDRSSAPSPPATGEYFWEFCWLDPGETICYNFYKLPHSTSAGTWSMWGLVDSWPNTWGNVQESNENNNTYGPVTITWLDPLSPHDVSRTDMVDHALEFLNVNWTCSELNATPHWSCPIWRCWFTPGQNYTGEAYSWGGWDKPNTDFLTYLSAGLCVGSIKDSTCEAADPYWATGVDCSGLVSRCWELPARRTTSNLEYVSDQITIGELRSGDIMNKPGSHVMMFYQWVVPHSIMKVIESTPPLVTDDNNYDTLYLHNNGYLPYKYKWVDDPENNDPVITGHIQCKYPQEECGDCIKHNEQMTIEIYATDPDGDPLHYVWWCSYGWFIVGGNPVSVCTTYENYVIYQAPDVWWNQDQLFVDVCDDRGGDTLASYHIEVVDPEYTCICGDVNDDLSVELGDIVYLNNYVFRGGPPPYDPYERGDVNNDCEIELGDIVYLINSVFRGGPPPECCWFPPEQ